MPTASTDITGYIVLHDVVTNSQVLSPLISPAGIVTWYTSGAVTYHKSTGVI